ncbi:C1q-like domain-containing protein [Emticicia sp. SJ17W-69]|uniref:C1q-like domain-containing protein n=1 Tax=Emticicia sp. SJ17W-69 TaxID=3421657 RepID=UPI003EC0FDFB
MKIFIFFITFISTLNVTLGQSVTISPSKIDTKQDEFNNSSITLTSHSQPSIFGIRYAGNLASPSSIPASTSLLALFSRGYNGTTISGITGFINFSSTENFTPSSNGTAMIFGTAINGTTTAFERMRITQDGKIGIGTTTVSANEIMEINGRIRLRRGAFASGFWLNNSANGTALTDGAFIGLNNETAGSETAGFWLNGAFRWYVDRNGGTTQNSATVSNLAGTGLRNVYADANGTLTTTGNAVAFRAKRSNTFVFTSNGGTNTIYFDNEEYDPSNAFTATTSSGIFTAPETGIYHFDISVVINCTVNSPSTGQYVRLSIQNASNNEIAFKDYFILNNEIFFTINLSTDLQLNSGMQIRPVLINQTSALISPSNGSSTYFNGHLIR